MAKDEQYTPKWIFDALGLEFDLDVASSHNPYVVVPTKQRFTIEDDALQQDWHGLVWMNPPYSGVTPWVEKWLNHGNGFCLVPLGSQGKWVNRLWESEAKLTYMPPNMKSVKAAVEQIKDELGGELQGEAPICKHGHMIWKQGEKNGKAWGGYLCTEKTKAQQCPPQWMVLGSDGKWKQRI